MKCFIRLKDEKTQTFVYIFTLFVSKTIVRKERRISITFYSILMLQQIHVVEIIYTKYLVNMISSKSFFNFFVYIKKMLK